MNKHMDDFMANMAIKNFSSSTQKTYSYQGWSRKTAARLCNLGWSRSTAARLCNLLKFFLTHCQDKKEPINFEMFKNYLFDLIKNNKMSNSVLKQSIGAIKFFLSTPSICLMN